MQVNLGHERSYPMHYESYLTRLSDIITTIPEKRVNYLGVSYSTPTASNLEL